MKISGEEMNKIDKEEIMVGETECLSERDGGGDGGVMPPLDLTHHQVFHLLILLKIL